MILGMLEGLVDLLRRERESDTIQALPPAFISNTTAYFKGLKQAAEQAPNYREADMLRDELKSAIVIYNSIIDLRRGKIVHAALLGARPDILGLESNSPEYLLYEGVAVAIKNYNTKASEPLDSLYRGGI